MCDVVQPRCEELLHRFGDIAPTNYIDELRAMEHTLARFTATPAAAAHAMNNANTSTSASVSTPPSLSSSATATESTSLPSERKSFDEPFVMEPVIVQLPYTVAELTVHTLITVLLTASLTLCFACFWCILVCIPFYEMRCTCIRRSPQKKRSVNWLVGASLVSA